MRNPASIPDLDEPDTSRLSLRSDTAAFVRRALPGPNAGRAQRERE
jgi:hypothetical protein